jgi:hypothetical protein
MFTDDPADMDNFLEKGEYRDLFAGISKEDILKAAQKIKEAEPINIFGDGFYKREKNRYAFTRTTNLEQDIIGLRDKWFGTDQEVLVQHMIDSLIIFLHNKDNLRGKDLKLRKLEQLKNIKTNDNVYK